MGVWKYGSEKYTLYLPQNDIFNSKIFSIFKTHFHTFVLPYFIRGQGWIRTTELRREQIYSLLSLAT